MGVFPASAPLASSRRAANMRRMKRTGQSDRSMSRARWTHSRRRQNRDCSGSLWGYPATQWEWAPEGAHSELSAWV